VFLGNVDDKTADAVQKAAAFIKAAPFSLRFDELNFWPKPRVLCLTCRRQPKPLYVLVNALTRMVQEHSVRLDNNRPYRAHITLARKATANPQLEFGAIEWSADSFALVQSRSTDKGVCYEVIDSWPLSKD
jgi:2'-5' RNA ligase